MNNKFNTENLTKVVGNEFLSIFFDKDNDMYYTVDNDSELVDEDKNYSKIEKMFRIFSAIAFSNKATA